LKFQFYRGSTSADFLTDGNPKGGLKTVAELQEFDYVRVEICRLLAFHYSKQLYEIFKNKEDPFFPWLSELQVPFQNDKKLIHVHLY